MRCVRTSKHSDVKDRVYGALNLISPRISVQIEPNYRLSAQDIFTDFAKACITSTKSLEILRQAGNNENVKPNVKDYIDQTSLYSGQGKICPTWVPDLRRELSNAGLKSQYSLQYQFRYRCRSAIWRSQLLSCTGIQS
jgi:hypothetical protein